MEELDVGGRTLRLRDGSSYVAHGELLLGAKVAMATGRPLLLRGPPGSGKSSFPRFLASELGRRYYGYQFRGRTLAEDLLWREFIRPAFPSPAHAQESVDNFIIQPGVLWWAADPVSARLQRDRASSLQVESDRESDESGEPAVVLLAHVDRVRPDVALDLVELLQADSFFVEPLGDTIAKGEAVLPVLTSEDNRRLPDALIDASVCVTVPVPALSDLVEIITNRWPAAPYEELRDFTEYVSRHRHAHHAPLTPGLLLRLYDACKKLGFDIGTGANTWSELAESVGVDGEYSEREPRRAGGIFVSYRRSDAECQAGRLYDWLTTEYDGSELFFDIESIDVGQDFEDVIRQTLQSVGVVLAVIGPSWLSAADEQGKPRLRDAQDLVRTELALALQASIPVVPVLVGGAQMPTESDLPGPLAEICRSQAATLRTSSFQSDVDRLMRQIQHLRWERSSE